MEFEVTAPRSELARVLQRHIAATNAAPREAEGRALINTGLQSANTLLHDGHRWERLTPRQIVTDTRDMLARSGRFSVIVHASYAFLRGAEERQRVGFNRSSKPPRRRSSWCSTTADPRAWSGSAIAMVPSPAIFGSTGAPFAWAGPIGLGPLAPPITTSITTTRPQPCLPRLRDRRWDASSTQLT